MIKIGQIIISSGERYEVSQIWPSGASTAIDFIAKQLKKCGTDIEGNPVYAGRGFSYAVKNWESEEKMKFRVWNIINIPNKPTHYHVDSPKEGILLINKMANEQLKIASIKSNAFGLNYFDEEEKEWLEWEDDDGNNEGNYVVVGENVMRFEDKFILV